jgi:hypothetical protein
MRQFQRVNITFGMRGLGDDHSLPMTLRLSLGEVIVPIKAVDVACTTVSGNSGKQFSFIPHVHVSCERRRGGRFERDSEVTLHAKHQPSRTDRRHSSLVRPSECVLLP